MSDKDTIEITGLQISNNSFSGSPPGSLAVAENVVMPQKGVAEPRRGQEFEAITPGATVPMQLTVFGEHVIANTAANKVQTNYGLGYVAAGITTPYAGDPYNPVDCDGVSQAYGRMKFGFAASFLHFCTTLGPKTLEAYNGTPRQAGLLRMPDPEVRMASASSLGANGVGLAYGYARGYCSVLRKPTSTGVSLLSPPSGVQVVQNRILAPIGGMVRVTNVVTVTLPGVINPGLNIADTFTISPGEANFPAALETVASSTLNVLTYADIAANAVNTVAQDLNTGPRPVVLLVLLSPDATIATPVRIYRSRDTLAAVPSPDMFLVAEVLPDGTDISNGYIAFLDVTPQSVTDDPLYTNQTEEGARSANFLPPIYRDTANWGGMQFYLNTTGLQELHIQLLGVGAPDGVQDGDTIDIAGGTFTFKNTPAGPDEVQIVSNGTPAFNIQQTAQFLIDAIFLMFGSLMTIRGYYESTQSGSPGKILLQATSYAQEHFAVEASRVQSWIPALPADTQAERVPNGFAWSKPGQPEAVPALNYSFAGARNYAIRRGFGLQQALLLLKAGDGIYSVTGAPPFNIQQISTANIIAPDCACVMEDAVFAYTDQGILRVSDSGGATVISRPIETELNRLRALFPTETHDWAFAVPYEQERRILFFVPFEIDPDSSRVLLRAWCYNVATQAWTGPLYEDIYSGVVNTDELRLKLGSFASSTNGLITSERNEQDFTDYADFNFTATIQTVAHDSRGKPCVRFLVATGISAGDGITQGQWRTRIKQARPDLAARWFELYEDMPFTAGVAVIYQHYDVTVQFQPQGSPSQRKALTRLAWLFKPEWFESFTAKSLVLTDQIQANLEIPTPSTGYGYGPYGQGSYGNPTPLVVDVNPISPQWANAAQFFIGLSTAEAWMKLRLQGFVLKLEGADAPVGRGR